MFLSLLLISNAQGLCVNRVGDLYENREQFMNTTCSGLFLTLECSGKHCTDVKMDTIVHCSQHVIVQLFWFCNLHLVLQGASVIFVQLNLSAVRNCLLCIHDVDVQ